MKPKIIIGSIIIVVFVIFGAYSFLESSVEYMDFEQAKASTKKVQVKGFWLREKESYYSPSTNQFSFYMVDEKNAVMKVVLEGAKPNNFEIATSIVVKGRSKDDYFHATGVLTKCPSKYEGTGREVKQSS